MEGNVSNRQVGLEDVHIQNITNMQFSVTTRTGNFRISLAAGDTLIFSHVSMKDLIKVVEQEEISVGKMAVVMERIGFLEGKYMDYMKENFKAPEGEIQQFLDHLVEQVSLTPVLNSENEDQMKFYLLDQWFRFREK